MPLAPEPARGGHRLVARGQADDAANRLVAVEEPDQHTVQRDAARIGARAVDRVDRPAPAALTLHDAELLADHAVARTGVREPAAQELLGFAVGGGDRRSVGLEVESLHS